MECSYYSYVIHMFTVQWYIGTLLKQGTTVDATGRSKHTQQSQPHAMQQQIDTDFVELSHVRVQSHVTKRYSAVERRRSRVWKEWDRSYFVRRAVLLQPITGRITAGADF